MKDQLVLAVRKFLEDRWEPGKPILLGYSGGPDSKTLLHTVLQCRRWLDFELHLAHVDHGWRVESERERIEIQEEAQRLGLPLHWKKLGSEDFSQGNLEDQGREHRLRFFSELYTKLNCQGLLLGHHADDRAEVVLKRVFEGASLFNLAGVVGDSELMGMRLWRPLLFAPKDELIAWLAKNELSYFSDPTNSSPQFLRGRMREQMLPFLRNCFGKEISANLCHLGEEAKEVREYFLEINRPLLARIERRPEGALLDLNSCLPIAALQLKHLLIEWMRLEGVTFSRSICEGIAESLRMRSGPKKFLSKKGAFAVHNGTILFSKLI